MAIARMVCGLGVLLCAGAALTSSQTSPAVSTRDGNAAREPTSSISGRVIVAGETPPVPVRRARVRIDGDVPDSGRYTDTDTDGRYQFAGLRAGPYRVTADKPGYVSLPAGASRPFTRPPPIALAAGEAKRVDIALPRGAALEGRVFGEDGDPAQNTSVAAVRMVATLSGRQPVAVAQARTDDLGRLRLHSLPAGDYFIEASPDPLAPPALQSGSAASRGLARTYYPGSASVTDAQNVRLATAEERSGLDFDLVNVPMARVTLRVVDSAGQTPASASCRVQGVGGPVGVVRGFVAPPNLNVCVFPAVPPGDYWLMAASRPAIDAPAEFAATRLSVSGGDLGEILLRTARGARVDGLVRTAGNEPPPSLSGALVVAHRVTYEPPSPDRGQATTEISARVTSEGRFAFPGLFGPTVLRLDRLPHGWSLASVWLEDREITDRIEDFRATDRSVRLVMTITRRTAQLMVTVAEAAHALAPDARAVIFPADERLWAAPSRFVHVALPDEEGRFVFDALLPGSYLVVVREYVEDDSWHDAGTLQGWRGDATPVVVAAGDSAALTVKMGRVP
ncbi:MAG: carboxypeptidase-like regulatory domain-containing protein [Acidobacteriota bacterium]